MARTAERIQMGLAALVILGVFSQVYFIAAYFFGAGADALDVHKTVGGIVHGLEVLVLVAALFSKADRWLAFALAAIGTVQLALADADKWAGGLHGLFATFVLLLAAAIAWRARGRSS
jgi:hypothetical protein